MGSIISEEELREFIELSRKAGILSEEEYEKMVFMLENNIMVFALRVWGTIYIQLIKDGVIKLDRGDR